MIPINFYNKSSLLGFFLFSVALSAATASASSPCEVQYGKPLAFAASLEGRFVWSRPGTVVRAKAWSPANGPRSTSGATDERRALVGLESDTDCLALLEGSDNPKSTAFEITGDLVLEKLEISPGKDLLVVKSQTFNSSIAEHASIFSFNGGAPHAALKHLLTVLSYASSPSGVESTYPLRVSSPGVLEYGDADKMRSYRFDFKAMSLVLR